MSKDLNTDAPKSGRVGRLLAAGCGLVALAVLFSTIVEPPSHPLVGGPAPALSLPLLDGGTLDLALHAGEEAVVLDFWATWCPPCRANMPVLNRVIQDFEDQGVVLYYVNLGDSVDSVRAFVEEAGLTAPMALDPTGEAAVTYRANPIPLTVFIRRDGTVHRARHGTSPDLESEFRRDVEELLAQ